MIKLFKTKENKNQQLVQLLEDYNALYVEYKKAKIQFDIAWDRFLNAQDRDMIDLASHQLSIWEKTMDVLLKKMKEVNAKIKEKIKEVS